MLFKSLLAGVGAGLVAATGALMVEIAWTIGRFNAVAAAGGGTGAVSFGFVGPAIVGLLAFLAVSHWRYHSLRRKARS